MMCVVCGRKEARVADFTFGEGKQLQQAGAMGGHAFVLDLLDHVPRAATIVDKSHSGLSS